MNGYGLCAGNPGPWQHAGPDATAAINTCCRCPVLDACTRQALDLEECEWDTWGGLTPSQRRRMVDAAAMTRRLADTPPADKEAAAERQKWASYMHWRRKFARLGITAPTDVAEVAA